MRFIFISHASVDDGFVAELRTKPESLWLSVWVARHLRGGSEPEIHRPTEHARQVIVVLSPDTIRSSWVRREIK